MPMRRLDSRSACCVMRSAGRLPPPCLAPLPQIGIGGMTQFPYSPLALHAGTIRLCRAGLCASGSLQQLVKFASSCRVSDRAKAAIRCCSEPPPVLLELCRLAWPQCGRPSAAGPEWLCSEPCPAPLELRRRPQRLHGARRALASPLPRTAPGPPGASCSELRNSCASSWGQGPSSVLSGRCAVRRSAPSLPCRAAALAGQACAQAPRKPQAGQGLEGLAAPRDAVLGACAGSALPRLPPHALGNALPPGRATTPETLRVGSIAQPRGVLGLRGGDALRDRAARSGEHAPASTRSCASSALCSAHTCCAPMHFQSRKPSH